MIILEFTLMMFFVLIVIFSIIFFSTPLFSRIPFVPCRKKVLNKIVDTLKLQDNSVLYDLGCGDGRILFSVAKKNKNISCIGVEIAPFPYLLAKIKKFFSGSKNVTILYGNLFKTDISPATHIFLYLFPKILDELLPKFEKELKPGTRIVSCDFQFSKREPNEIVEIESRKWQINKKLYIYIF